MNRDDLAAAGVPSLAAWWCESGRPGYVADATLGSSQPWTLAGHVVGAWALDEPFRTPGNQPWPGLLTVESNIGVYDSATVSVVDGAAWHGFSGALVRAAGLPQDPHTPHSGGVVDLRNGTYGFDDNALMIERADARSWLRLEVMEATRAEFGAYDVAGHHLWSMAGSYRFRGHEIDVGFAQRAKASALIGTEEQAASMESGYLGYAHRIGTFDLDVNLSRGRTTHESFGSFFIVPRPEFGEALAYSSRDAQDNRASAEIRGHLGGHQVGARIELKHERVVRDGAGAFLNESSSWWAATRYQHRVGDGDVELDLGAGRHSAYDQIEVAPSLSYRIRGSVLDTRVGIERLVRPVWTDLAAGQAPFMQRTWAGVLEARAHFGERLNGWSTFMIGRTQDRAVARRFPLEDMWLRTGFKADPERYDFGQLWLGGAWRPGPLTLGAEGFILVRQRSAVQPLVDPAKGFRSYVAWHSSPFQGDLGLTLRFGVDGVGARDTDDSPSRSLAGYVTSNAAIVATLLDATITVQARNLEDQQREDVWVDSDSGELALGAGREIRFSVTVRLRD